ncbi:hypothetical protein D3C76_596920 [compost metagenome]
MNALGKTTDGRRPRFHRHAGDALEQGGRQDHIGFLAGGIQQVRAHNSQHQFESRADQQTDRQHPQGRSGLVRHHAIVGLHHEQRHHQSQQVDQEARQDRIAVQPFRQLQRIAKPGLDPRHQRRSQVFEFVTWPGEQCLATVVFGQLLWAEPLFAAVGFAGQDQHLAVLAITTQHSRAAVVEQQQHGQVERGDVFEVAAQQARLQTGPGRCTGQQVQAQALVCHGEPGTEAGATDRRAVEFAEDQQTVQKRVIEAQARIDTGVAGFHAGH